MVRRYIRNLEEEGYIRVDVIFSPVTSLVVGLEITLLSYLFAPHHQEKWPEHGINLGRTRETDNYSSKVIVGKCCRKSWSSRCMNAVRKRYLAIKEDQGEFDLQNEYTESSYA